jgi:hypothetical protein
MRDVATEILDLQLDIATLRTLIDVALDRGTTGEDPLLLACSQILHERRKRLALLERAGRDGR